VETFVKLHLGLIQIAFNISLINQLRSDKKKKEYYVLVKFIDRFRFAVVCILLQSCTLLCFSVNALFFWFRFPLHQHELAFHFLNGNLANNMKPR
jgi:hypothetical protein